MGLPEFTSASQLSTYARCPRQYRFKYLDDDAQPEFRSVGLALGSVVHGGVEWWFEQKRRGRAPTVETAMQIVAADFAAATHDPIRLGAWTLDDLRAHAQTLVRTAIEHFGDIEVEGTEMRFELPLYDPDTGECVRTLVGYFDIYLGPGRVMELKTARSAYDALQLSTSLQFGAYLMALDQHTEGGELELAVLIKTKVPRVQRLKLHPNARAERWFLRAATDIENAITAGNFPPAPGFGCGGCEYQRRCLGATEVGDDRRAA